MPIAIDDAKAQANRLATGFGAKLGRIRTIGPSSGGNALYSGSTVRFGAGSFAPGTIHVKSAITVTFLLDQ